MKPSRIDAVDRQSPIQKSARGRGANGGERLTLARRYALGHRRGRERTQRCARRSRAGRGMRSPGRRSGQSARVAAHTQVVGRPWLQRKAVPHAPLRGHIYYPASARAPGRSIRPTRNTSAPLRMSRSTRTLPRPRAAPGTSPRPLRLHLENTPVR